MLHSKMYKKFLIFFQTLLMPFFLLSMTSTVKAPPHKETLDTKIKKIAEKPLSLVKKSSPKKPAQAPLTTIPTNIPAQSYSTNMLTTAPTLKTPVAPPLIAGKEQTTVIPQSISVMPEKFNIKEGTWSKYDATNDPLAFEVFLSVVADNSKIGGVWVLSCTANAELFLSVNGIKIWWGRLHQKDEVFEDLVMIAVGAVTKWSVDFNCKPITNTLDPAQTPLRPKLDIIGTIWGVSVKKGLCKFVKLADGTYMWKQEAGKEKAVFVASAKDGSVYVICNEGTPDAPVFVTYQRNKDGSWTNPLVAGTTTDDKPKKDSSPFSFDLSMPDPSALADGQSSTDQLSIKQIALQNKDNVWGLSTDGKIYKLGKDKDGKTNWIDKGDGWGEQEKKTIYQFSAGPTGVWCGADAQAFRMNPDNKWVSTGCKNVVQIATGTNVYCATLEPYGNVIMKNTDQMTSAQITAITAVTTTTAAAAGTAAMAISSTVSGAGAGAITGAMAGGAAGTLAGAGIGAAIGVWGAGIAAAPAATAGAVIGAIIGVVAGAAIGAVAGAILMGVLGTALFGTMFFGGAALFTTTAAVLTLPGKHEVWLWKDNPGPQDAPTPTLLKFQSGSVWSIRMVDGRYLLTGGEGPDWIAAGPRSLDSKKMSFEITINPDKTISLKSLANNKFVSAIPKTQPGNAWTLIAKATVIGLYEKFIFANNMLFSFGVKGFVTNPAGDAIRTHTVREGLTEAPWQDAINVSFVTPAIAGPQPAPVAVPIPFNSGDKISFKLVDGYLIMGGEGPDWISARIASADPKLIGFELTINPDKTISFKSLLNNKFVSAIAKTDKTTAWTLRAIADKIGPDEKFIYTKNIVNMLYSVGIKAYVSMPAGRSIRTHQLNAIGTYTEASSDDALALSMVAAPGGPQPAPVPTPLPVKSGDDICFQISDGFLVTGGTQTDWIYAGPATADKTSMTFNLLINPDKTYSFKSLTTNKFVSAIAKTDKAAAWALVANASAVGPNEKFIFSEGTLYSVGMKAYITNPDGDEIRTCPPGTAGNYFEASQEDALSVEIALMTADGPKIMEASEEAEAPEEEGTEEQAAAGEGGIDEQTTAPISTDQQGGALDLGNVTDITTDQQGAPSTIDQATDVAMPDETALDETPLVTTAPQTTPPPATPKIPAISAKPQAKIPPVVKMPTQQKIITPAPKLAAPVQLKPGQKQILVKSRAEMTGKQTPTPIKAPIMPQTITTTTPAEEQEITEELSNVDQVDWDVNTEGIASPAA